MSSLNVIDCSANEGRTVCQQWRGPLVQSRKSFSCWFPSYKAVTDCKKFPGTTFTANMFISSRCVNVPSVFPGEGWNTWAEKCPLTEIEALTESAPRRVYSLRRSIARSIRSRRDNRSKKCPRREIIQVFLTACAFCFPFSRQIGAAANSITEEDNRLSMLSTTDIKRGSKVLLQAQRFLTTLLYVRSSALVPALANFRQVRLF